MSQKKVRDALLTLASTTSGFRGAFGKQGCGVCHETFREKQN